LNSTEDRNRIVDILWGLAETRILIAAVELDVFTAISQGAVTAKALAENCGASERGIRILLNGLVAMQFLAKAGGTYALKSIASEHLVRGRKGYMGSNVLHTIHLWQGWGTLTDAVRQGTAVDLAKSRERGAKFFPVLVDALFPRNYPIACEMCEQLGIGLSWKKLRVLDVAGGSGPWSVAVAERDTQSRVTLIDYPEPVRVARRFARQHKVLEQFTYEENDLWVASWGRTPHDLVIFGHILHSEGAKKSQEMIWSAYACLKSGGKLVIAEMVADDSRSRDPWPLIFAVNMLVNTEAGDTFTRAEMRRWCRSAGFGKVESLPVQNHSPLIVATKGVVPEGGGGRKE